MTSPIEDASSSLPDADPDFFENILKSPNPEALLNNYLDTLLENGKKSFEAPLKELKQAMAGLLF